MNVATLDKTGKKGTSVVSDSLFAVPANPTLLAQAVRVYLSNLRQGTSRAKTRGEVNRTKRKWYKQKGTGNARHGARSANIFVGGGAAHGPKGVENWTRALSTTMKRQAVRLALSAQAANVTLVESLTDLDGKTKNGQALVDMLNMPGKKVLVVLAERNALVERSLRNIEDVLLMTANQLTALEVATADTIVMTKSCVETLEARLMAGTRAAKATKAVKSTKSVAVKSEIAKPASVKAAAKAPAKKTAVKKETKTTKTAKV